MGRTSVPLLPLIKTFRFLLTNERPLVKIADVYFYGKVPALKVSV